ncbi:RrF2 family transcriptional regulator [Flammeovirga aprica]|uniref:Rrf2 family transcriptional regulator n=1 Tax=Flammeovirga aprica JL-4 TaxID=694437 RepID=A0A7X9NZU0_9BACT|nr:Rrf2 family transcriptional regulator [Flammeovirga aprica]NME66908.1 Rrf2 family transcriptional regulator [Flammeovirga aprica JL-4]
MFSKACTYGIRALILITQRSNEGKKIGVKEIAEVTSTPEPFTAKILQQLSRQGVIQSIKGPKGGFFLDEEQQNTSIYDVVEAIDGDQLMTGCGLGFLECSDEKPCPMHAKFKSIRASINKMLETTTLKDLSDDVEGGLSFLALKR